MTRCVLGLLSVGLLAACGALRDFNFTTYTVTERGVSAEVRGLARGGSARRVMDRFEMGWR